MTFRSASNDLDKVAAMRALFARYAVPWETGYGWQKMHCLNPEHLDTEESASINSTEGAYKCHACGVKGDAYALLQQIEGVDFKRALEILGADRDLGADRGRGDSSPGRMTWI